MRAFYTKRFLEHYAEAPPTIQRAVDRRVALLVQNLLHPSLRLLPFLPHPKWPRRFGGTPEEVSGIGKTGAMLKKIEGVLLRKFHWCAKDAREAIAAV